MDRFLEALACVPVAEVEGIRAMFDAYSDREALASLFHERLTKRPCGDLGRFMMLLSGIGQLAHPTSLDHLHRLIWAEDADLLIDSPKGAGHAESSCCMFPPSGMIQARAAEMFAWIAVCKEDEKLLEVVAKHSSVTTRLAAADAFLFAHHDADAARARVADAAHPEDRHGIGVPRFVRGCDRAAFDRALRDASADQPKLPPERGIAQRNNLRKAK
ncbi:hypothetical protein [Paraburkholderia strydomiana]|uniref:hypothetical protein n=1 Tax=Paraburkholderia strydomiana TaxID=1245417 RepID=UPI0038BB2B54